MSQTLAALFATAGGCSGVPPHLCADNGDDGLGVDKVGVAEVVQATVTKDGGPHLPPRAGAHPKDFGGEAAHRAEHRPPAVNHLHADP